MANSYSSQNSPENLYAILIIVFGVVLGYILYSNQPFPIEVSAPALEAARPDEAETVTKLENISLDFSIFDNIVFKELKIFGEIPVIPGVTGKNDPFSPF